MTIIQHMKEIQNDDGSVTVPKELFDRFELERTLMKRLAWNLVGEYKEKANQYLFKTRHSRAYRAMKDFLQDRTK